MVFADKKYIADKIKEYRKRHNLTQAELAEKVNISTKQISRIEVGDFYPSITTFLKIIEVLNIDFSVFIEHPKSDENSMKTKLINILSNASEEELNFYDRLITFANDEAIEIKKNLLLKRVGK